ncbi:hypothetical protein [Pacificibacter marinus]|uniref:hypothetical protein n=1 Tax=Pacificibacter marinus TaxID=658057 RepID=UPI001C07DCC0|nr:hypothetical protein [Pacificibacter marinus]MBU2865739.1 hypothetical protein [Pacificibacter marinus]
MAHHETKAILKRAEEVLMTAELGLTDLNAKDKQRRNVGLRNIIVFGRSVTFVLQNLRNKEPDFDNWYYEIQAGMKNDPVFKYFLQARNNLEKQGKVSISTSAQIHNFSSKDLSRMGPRPPSADGFFIGDQMGGSGWTSKLPDGTELKYYVDLPEDIGNVTQHFSDLENEIFKPIRGKSVDELSDDYIKKLSKILDLAKQHFLSEPPTQWVKGKRLPSYIKVIK